MSENFDPYRAVINYLPDDTSRRGADGLDTLSNPTTAARANPRERKPVVATPYVWTPPEAIPTRQWLYGRYLLRKFVSATVAPGGVGKAALNIAETCAMVSGKNLLGGTLPHVGRLRVWYLNLEDPREEISRQIQATALQYGLQPDDFGDRLFVDSGREQEFVIAETQPRGAVICRPVVDSIIDQLLEHAIDCLIVDPFVSSHAVAENDNGAIDMVIKQWGKIADATNCAIGLVHHTRKAAAGDTEVTAESSRGGKALVDGCRAVRVINRMTKEEAERAGVDNPRLYFRTLNDKANLTPPSERSDWYRLVGVDLGNGGQRPGDELGVVTKWSWPDAFDGVTTGDLQRVQVAMASGEWKENAQAKNWAGRAVADTLDLDLTDPSARAKVKAMLKEWTANGVLRIVRKPDEYRRDCPFVEVGEWVK
ncbi:MAG TPA: AAA family ATPase [Devosiaceae bacterium]|jgi:hypothetical protein|nr:AAA family ATPase [Devosiaceae bacterium]